MGFLVAALVLGCGSPGDPTHLVPEGQSQRMVERLAALADSANPRRNPFINDARVDWMLEVAPPVNPRTELEFARELLRAGRSAEAADGYRRILDEQPSDSPGGAELVAHLRSMLAIAYLRMGEQENCLEQHNSDSCLLPIEGGGVYSKTETQRVGMAVLSQLLDEDPQDLLSRWLYNIAAMTVGDYPERVPTAWLIPPQSFDSDYDIGRFPDRAAHVGLATEGLAGGSIVEDFDGDGYLDVMVSSWGLRDPLHFFLNQRDGTFEDRTLPAGLNGINGGLNLVHADYDNDGDADVLVLRGAWLGAEGQFPNSLLENRGRGADGVVTFVDVTEEVGLLSFAPTQTAAWGDFDNDGWLDLFVGNESLPGFRQPSQLYRSRGRGEGGTVTFVEVAAEFGVATEGYIKGVTWGDVDNDGRLDLYVSRLLEPNQLFHNQGEHFVERAAEAGVSEPLNSFPTWLFDYDNAGRLDLFVSGYSKNYQEAQATQVAAEYLGLPTTAEHPRLYRNVSQREGDLSFVDVTAAAGVDKILLGMGANFGDLDNDGFLDFYVGTGAPDYRALVPNRMFHNAGDGTFQDVTKSGGFGHLQKGHGVSFGDLDNDGDQDLLHVLGGAYSGDRYQNALFVNPGHGNHWVTLRLEGEASNRSAIGARIRLVLETPSGKRQVFATVSTGGSFGSSSLQQEIGLGDALRVELVEVGWPAGGTDRFSGIPMDSILLVREGAVEVERVALEQLSF
ncbi:MAG: CRTAC1 family protein [Thermoanaerobaculia bacterium]|nr:CRTAC1 family protein [Thermoanaerobaculia bacterium]